MELDIWITVMQIKGRDEVYTIVHPNHADLLQYARANHPEDQEVILKMENNPYSKIRWTCSDEDNFVPRSHNLGDVAHQYAMTTRHSRLRVKVSLE